MSHAPSCTAAYPLPEDNYTTRASQYMIAPAASPADNRLTWLLDRIEKPEPGTLMTGLDDLSLRSREWTIRLSEGE